MPLNKRNSSVEEIIAALIESEKTPKNPHPDDWFLKVGHFFDTEPLNALRLFLKQEYAKGIEVYPPKDKIFSAFFAVPFEKVKVVLIGQDPYHGPGQAMGRSFAVPRGTKIPPSLLNIFKEVEQETGQRPKDSELMSWVDQGVFLLNSVLTVRRGEAFSHAGKGWEHFTNGVIEALGNRGTPLVFLLWGSAAWQKKSLIRGKHHLILESPHPSPLSAYRGFFGNGHFLKTNEFLKKNRMLPISWS
jgi:uracil-DNA glycosylase